jgi:hypothetical protein
MAGFTILASEDRSNYKLTSYRESLSHSRTALARRSQVDTLPV